MARHSIDWLFLFSIFECAATSGPVTNYLEKWKIVFGISETDMKCLMVGKNEVYEEFNMDSVLQSNNVQRTVYPGITKTIHLFSQF